MKTSAPCCFPLRCIVILVLGACSLFPGAPADAQLNGTPGIGSGVTSGPQTAPTAQSPAAQTFPAANPSMLYPGEDFQLGPGDLVSVRLFGSADYGATGRIGLDGTMELPYIGSVPLQGLTARTAQNRIEEKLRTEGFYKNPEIIIQVLDTVNGSVMITGEMHATVPVTTERSLRDVLLAAGGLPANASHTVTIVRPVPGQPGQTKVIAVVLGTDLAASEAANIPVYPHDIVQITRASVVYVLGAFTRQGAVPLDQATPLTLLQLAALSGGINFEGKYEDLRLIRTVDNQRKLVQVDIKRVREGKAPDPVLEANDIVFLPTNPMKAALKSLGIGGVLGLVSLIYSLHTY